MKKAAGHIFWFALALLGAWAFFVLATQRGEPVNSVFILIAALCTYAIGYRFYSKWIATKLLMLDDRRATPCEVHDDGKDFCKTNRWIVFGHHFAAISGPGPLVGPVLAAQFGYLPGTLWILIGVVLGGAVQDFVILFASIRRNGKTLAEMVKEEMNSTAGFIAMVAILAILVILTAVLGLVVVKALAGSPWAVFTVGATFPIALLMGVYLRFWRVGRVLEVTAIGVTLLLLSVWGGKFVYQNAAWSHALSLPAITLAWILIAYGLASSVLPVWLLLAPRDYLSTFMKLGTIIALALGIFCVLPHLQMPAITKFIDGSGPVVPGKLFPFCFITIACGAISGFHTLVASGTTPKMITREGYARSIGYGAMCLESLVAIMALIAACSLEPGVYMGMNIKGDPADTVAKVTALGFPVTVDHMNQLAAGLGEKTLFGRTGGAATLAVGMAQIFSGVTRGRWLDLWYHFAIMFEALFILTTIAAGTRVGRYVIQDFLGRIWKPLGDKQAFGPNLFACALMTGGWGYFLIQGVYDPLGGINSLWPLFGIANQMLAAIGLCLATTIILKMQLRRTGVPPVSETAKLETGKMPVLHSPWFALVTLVPLVWLVAVTFTAGAEKIWHPDPRIGFLAQADELGMRIHQIEDQQPKDIMKALPSGESADELQALLAKQKIEEKISIGLARELPQDRALRFNNLLDAAVTFTFLVLVSIIVIISMREWLLLLGRRKLADLRESDPVWLPDYAVAEGRPLRLLGLFALSLALAKELSGEAQMERARQQACACVKNDAQIYTKIQEERFNGVTRCC